MIESLAADIFDPKWIDLSDEHKEKKEELKRSILNFINGEKVPPICIIGPYGIGKTELMFEGFRFAWKNTIPALYTTLRKILGFIDRPIDEQQLPKKLDEIVRNNIEKLRKAFDEGSKLSSDIFLPNAEGKTVEEYFSRLGEVTGLEVQDFKRILEESEYCILFIDEMEEGWRGDREKGIKGLIDVVVAETGRLRELFRAIERRDLCFYLVMGFGLISLYEVLGAAEAGTQKTIRVPLLRIDELGNYLKREEIDPRLSKFLWWASRSRPRWVKKLITDHLSDIKRLHKGEIDFSEFLDRIGRTEIENIPIIDYLSLSDIRDKDVDKALSELIFINPIDIKDISDAALSKFIDKNLVFVASSDEDMIDIDEIVYAFTEDLKKLSKEKNIDIDDNKIRVYLKRILSAIANNGKIMVGCWTEKAGIFAYGFVAPLILLLHDFMLEFEGEGGEENEAQRKQKNTIEFLYGIIKDFGIGTDSIAGKWEFLSAFENTLRLFKETSKPTKWQASLKLVETIFPRIIVNPNISREPIETIRARLEQHIKDRHNFLEQTMEIEDLRIKFIFVPSKDFIEDVTQKYFKSWREYLQSNIIFYILFLGGDTKDIKLKKDVAILKEIKKLQFSIIDERRLQDFIISSWYYDNFSNSEFLELLNEILKKEGTPKTIKRTVQYYKQRIENILLDKAKSTVNEYKEEIKKVIPFKDPDFPRDGINTIVRDIREDQTIDWIILGFGSHLNKNEVVDIFTKLRKLSEISSYKKIIEKHSATIHPKGLNINLERLSKFIRKFNEFPHAKEILELFFPMNIEDVREEETPLEILLDPKDTVEKIFIKAVTLRYLLNDEEVNKTFDKIISSIEDELENVKNLDEEVKEFNERIGKEIFSIGKLISINNSLKEIKESLSKSSIATPLKYVLIRISEKIIENIQKMRQEVKTAFDVSWKELRDFLDEIEQAKEDTKKNLEECFKDNRRLKESVFGDLNSLSIRMIEKIEKVKSEFLDEIGPLPIKLNKTQSMPSGISNKIQLKHERLRSLSSEVDKIQKSCRKIDDIVKYADKIKEKLQNIHKLIMEV